MQETADLLESLSATWQLLVDLLPRVFAALVILLAGWLIAKLLRRGTIRALRFLRVEDLAEHAGLEGFLMQGGVKYTTVTLLGGVVYWIVLFATFIALLTVLGIPAGRELIDRVVLFIPNVIVAVVILMFGTVVARFVSSLTYTYLNNIGSAAAEPISVVARYAILVFIVAMAAEQLALRSEILVSGFQIAFGALCLAVALAFGLGGREWAARLLDKYWKI